MITAVGLALAGTARAEQAAKPEPLQLDRLIEMALERNPQLQALRSAIAAERAKVPQARALPDPMFAVMFDDVLHPDRGIGYEARQPIPWPGKLGLMSRAAALSADRAVTDYTEKAFEVVAEVKKAYYDLHFLDQSVELTTANKDLLGDFAKIAQTKYSVGAGIQQDVLRAQVAQSRMLDDLLMLNQEQVSARARLNALLNRPPDAPLGPAAELARHKVSLPQHSLEEVALEQRAMLKGMRLMTAEAETMRALAQRDLKPDYEVRLGVQPGMEMGSAARVTGMVMFTVPLYHRTKQDQTIAQRTAELAAAQSAYEAQKTMTFAMIRDIAAMLERSDRQAELLHGGIIPQAQLSLESARAGYQVGKVDFLTLLDSQMGLYDSLRDYYRAVTDYEKGVADLERAVGAPLDNMAQPRLRQGYGGQAPLGLRSLGEVGSAVTEKGTE
jgi:outer membrane protein TolC